ncbi:MAG: NfeD family protein [Verrucomicrobia bacterium]|nr:NfeD family protein [Verrucomicrobiota bacterium]
MPRMELVVALLVVGALLLLAETVLPGMIAGILGAICILAGVVEGYVLFGPRTGSYILLGVLAALVAGTVLWLKYFPETRFARAFISVKTVGNINAEKPALLGQTGTALSHLRPSGIALIGGQRVDVVTEGARIDKGAPIKVVAIEGMRVVVRAVA